MAIVQNNVVQYDQVDTNSVVLKDDMYRDEMLTVSAAGTTKAGTILARAASGSLEPYVKGTNAPVSVLTYEVEVDAAGDVPIRALVSGDVRKQRLVIAADGDDSNIDNAVCDALRSTSIIPIDVHQADTTLLR